MKSGICRQRCQLSQANFSRDFKTRKKTFDMISDTFLFYEGIQLRRSKLHGKS